MLKDGLPVALGKTCTQRESRYSSLTPRTTPLRKDFPTIVDISLPAVGFRGSAQSSCSCYCLFSSSGSDCGSPDGETQLEDGRSGISSVTLE